MTKPIATIIREALPKGIWEKGWSKTYCDTSYTRTKKQTRWASKDLTEMSPDDQNKVKHILETALVKTGLADTVMVFWNEVYVYKASPVTILEAA